MARLVLETVAMDAQLMRSLVAVGAAVPYVVEVLGQLPLLTRVMRAMPREVRERLPRHPRREDLAVFGSTRFFLALFRYALRSDDRDTAEMKALKRRMRASVVREALFAVVLAATVTVLWRGGWRPWP